MNHVTSSFLLVMDNHRHLLRKALAVVENQSQFTGELRDQFKDEFELMLEDVWLPCTEYEMVQALAQSSFNIIEWSTVADHYQTKHDEGVTA